MKNEENEIPDPSIRSKRPTIRITAIWGKENYDSLPPKDIVMKAAEAYGHLLAMLGFNELCIGAGTLENCIDKSAKCDHELLDGAEFKRKATEIVDGKRITPEDRIDALNAAKLEALKHAKISVNEMLKGIDMNRTHNEEK